MCTAKHDVNSGQQPISSNMKKWKNKTVCVTVHVNSVKNAEINVQYMKQAASLFFCNMCTHTAGTIDIHREMMKFTSWIP